MMYENITKDMIDKHIILGSTVTGSLISVQDNDTVEARESMAILEWLDVLPSIELIIADPCEDPNQNECVIYGWYSDHSRNYLGSEDGSDLVKGMSYDLKNADRYNIIDVDIANHMFLIYSKKNRKYLSVDMSESTDPDKGSYRIKAEKEVPDESCIFCYAG